MDSRYLNPTGFRVTKAPAPLVIYASMSSGTDR